jgi:hypothetical protein
MVRRCWALIGGRAPRWACLLFSGVSIIVLGVGVGSNVGRLSSKADTRPKSKTWGKAELLNVLPLLRGTDAIDAHVDPVSEASESYRGKDVAPAGVPAYAYGSLVVRALFAGLSL